MLDLNQRLNWLKNIIGEKNAVLGLSGGVDSSVCLALLSKILSPHRLYLLSLPCADQDDNSALETARHFGLEQRLSRINILPMLSPFQEALGIKENDRLRRGNLISRCRMICLYDWAKNNQALVCGTGNKSEVYLGYFTLWGDNAADFAPLHDLNKTQVYSLAAQLALPAQIINQAPSAELWPGQTDETELGFTYQLADQVIEKLERNDKHNEALKWSGEEQEVITRIKANSYKQKIPHTPPQFFKT